jgi:hypothetical protein
MSAVAAQRSAGTISAARKVSVHIFVTRYSRGLWRGADGPRDVPRLRETCMSVGHKKMRARCGAGGGFSTEQLWDLLCDPSVSAADWRSDPPAGARNSLGNVAVWAGRPRWDAIFAAEAAAALSDPEGPGEPVGVLFCGAAAIGAALQRCCAERLDGGTEKCGVRFELHKETF